MAIKEKIQDLLAQVAGLQATNPGVLKAGHENLTLTTYHSYVNYDHPDWALWWSKDWVRAGLGSGDGKYTPGGNTEELKSLNDMPDFKTESNTAVGLPPFMKKKHTSEMASLYPTEGYSVVPFEEKENYRVRDYLIYWLSSWVREFGIDGFRCDTAKHVEKEAWYQLKIACTQALRDWKATNKAIDNSDFWMTGEHWGHGVSKDKYFTDGGFNSMINFAFRKAAGSALTNIASIETTYSSYANKINKDSDFNVLSYISSHDTGADDGKGVFFSNYSNSSTSKQMVAGSLLAMCPGAIQVYYGDEAGREDSSFYTGSDKDQKNRSQMPWPDTDIEGYNEDLYYEFDKDIHAHWSKVLNFRAAHVAIGAGSHKQVTDVTAGYAFAREKGDDKVVVVMGATAGNVIIDVSSIGAAKVKDAYTGAVAAVTADGKATFTVTDANNGTLLIEAAE